MLVNDSFDVVIRNVIRVVLWLVFFCSVIDRLLVIVLNRVMLVM